MSLVKNIWLKTSCISLRNLRSTRTLMNVLHISRITWLRTVHLMVSLVSLRWVSVKFNLISFSLNWEKNIVNNWFTELIFLYIVLNFGNYESWVLFTSRNCFPVKFCFLFHILFSFSYSFPGFLSHGILNMQWFSGGNIVSWAAWSASSGTCSFVTN